MPLGEAEQEFLDSIIKAMTEKLDSLIPQIAKVTAEHLIQEMAEAAKKSGGLFGRFFQPKGS